VHIIRRALVRQQRIAK